MATSWLWRSRDCWQTRNCVPRSAAPGASRSSASRVAFCGPWRSSRRYSARTGNREINSGLAAKYNYCSIRKRTCSGSRAPPWSSVDLFQQCVDCLDVLHLDHAGRFLELQSAQHKLMACLRIGTLCLEQLLLAEQHVDDGAGADLETCLSGVERALRRNHGLFGCLDFADPGKHGTIGVARIRDDSAALQLHLVLRGIALEHRLTHLRRHQTTGEDRHVQGDADGGVVVQPGGREREETSAVERRGIIAPGRCVSTHDRSIECRQVA